MFGQNSNCPILRVTDGMSNTFMLAETCSLVDSNDNGSALAWGYRSWAMAGIDPTLGINAYPVVQSALSWQAARLAACILAVASSQWATAACAGLAKASACARWR